MKYHLYLLMILLQISCNDTSKSTDSQKIENEKKATIPTGPDKQVADSSDSIEYLFIQQIENAHKKETFLKQAAIQFDLDLSFGGKQRMDATITMLSNSSKIKIAKKDGSELLFDGKDVYLSPIEADDRGARFDIFTWSYFFGFPYKLSDPGTKWEIQENRKIKDNDYATAKLTFEKEVGDAPDDWYITFVDPKTNLIRAAAYIVTYGTKGDISRSESDPHIIMYENYQEVEGIPIAKTWKFYGWTSEKGITKELGKATLSAIRFINNPDNFLFKSPENGKIIPPP